MRYFSTFTGVGGLDMGLQDLGAHCVGYSEIKQSSMRIYREHYPKHKCFGDLTQIDFDALPDFDVLTGGFPCQSFSLAGARRGFKDRRGQMIFYLYDLLKAKAPTYAVFENVVGILNHNMGRTYLNILQLFGDLDYYVRVVQLNAAYYGSAQSRERVFFLLSKNDFARKVPEKTDASKRFRDIRDDDEEHWKLIPRTDFNYKKVNSLRLFDFELIGGYDRVGCLTTQRGCGEKVVQSGDWYRYLTPLECERLQGIPDGWTNIDGVRDDDKYFALGNAVNCGVSRYLFTNYLRGLWW